MAADCYVQRKSHGWFTDRQQEISAASRFSRQAAELGRDDAIALSKAAHTLSYVVGDVDSSVALIDQALAVNRSSIRSVCQRLGKNISRRP